MVLSTKITDRRLPPVMKLKLGDEYIRFFILFFLLLFMSQIFRNNLLNYIAIGYITSIECLVTNHTDVT